MVLLKAVFILIASPNRLEGALTKEKYIPSLKLLSSLGLLEVHIAPDCYMCFCDGEPVVGNDKVYRAEKTLSGLVVCWVVRILSAGLVALIIRMMLK